MGIAVLLNEDTPFTGADLNIHDVADRSVAISRENYRHKMTYEFSDLEIHQKRLINNVFFFSFEGMLYRQKRYSKSLLLQR